MVSMALSVSHLSWPSDSAVANEEQWFSLVAILSPQFCFRCVGLDAPPDRCNLVLLSVIASCILGLWLDLNAWSFMICLDCTQGHTVNNCTFCIIGLNSSSSS